jgi:hypothetical protein
LWAASVLLIASATIARAQTSFLLEIDSIESLPGDQIQIIFSDNGTGASSYQVETRPTVEAGSSWETDTGALIAPINGTSSSATLSLTGDKAFFRILAVDGSGGIEAVVTFSTDSITIDESAGTVNIPLHFSKPFQGTLNYQVTGSTTAQDIAPLSGTVTVNGSSASITIELVDNIDFNELRFLSLNLTAGTGYVLGTTNQANVIIRDDDTFWSGNFQQDGNPVGFSMKLERAQAGTTATIFSLGEGIFPSGEYPAQVTLTDSAFSLSITSVVLTADATMFNTPAELSLTMTATDGVEDQSVEDAEIEGLATLDLVFPAQPQLNTSLSGPFLMIQQVIKPSSKQVELTSN